MEQRIIKISVKNEYILGEGVVIGAAGSHDEVLLELDFRASPVWHGTTKKAVFYDALGTNPTTILLTTDKLVSGETEVYRISVPAEAKGQAGKCFLTIEGVVTNGETESVRVVTEAAQFDVLQSRRYEQTSDPKPVTPTQAEQLQAEIDDIKNTVSEAKDSADAAEASKKAAAASEQAAAKSEMAAKASETAAAQSVQAARQSATSAASSASDAEACKTAAEDAQKGAEAAVGKTSYIGDNGNWYEWDATSGAFVDSGISAKPFPYVQPEEPIDAPEFSLWVDTDEEALYIARAEGGGLLMPDYIIDGAVLTDIADAVREKTGAIEPIVPENMAEMLRNVEGDYESGYAAGYEIGYRNGKTDGLTEFIDKDYFVTGKVTNIEAWKYFSYSNITAAKFPYTTEIGNSAFCNCSNLVSVNFPLVTHIGNNAFAGCSTLVSVYLPLVESFGGSVFKGDPALEAVDFPKLDVIWELVFSDCTALKTVILRLNRVSQLKAADVFNNTPIANGTGYIYVPDDLVEQYKAATNWSVYASQIKPISELEGTV